MGYKVAVAGATGAVGHEMLNILAEREFPLTDLAVLASSRSQGDEIEFGDTGRMLKVQNIENFDPTGWDIALFAIGSDATKKCRRREGLAKKPYIGKPRRRTR